MADDEQFETAAAETADTIPKQASAFRKNGHVVLKDKPCKIVDMSTSKTGKHGHAKIHFVGIDIFTGKKYEDICPSTHNMREPIFKRCEKVLIDMKDDGFVSLMDDNGDIDETIKVTDECDTKPDVVKNMVEQQEEGYDLVATVYKCMGQEVIKKVEKKKQ